MKAPRAGFEPATSALTARRSTTELSRNKEIQSIYITPPYHFCQIIRRIHRGTLVLESNRSHPYTIPARENTKYTSTNA